jgi:hypothetical protein
VRTLDLAKDADLTRLRKEAADARTKLEAAQLETASLRGDRDATQKKLAQAEAALRSLRETARTVERDRVQLESRVVDHEAAMSDAANVAGTLEHELTLRDEQVIRTRAELEAAREEIVVLREQAAQAEELQREVAALTLEIADFKAMKFRASLPPPRSGATRTQPMNDASYQQLVDRLAESAGAKSAAITDELGFVVAGTGEHAEALAAFGAYLIDAGGRALEFFPMQELGSVTVEDAHGVRLCARPMQQHSPENLVLVTIGTNAHEPQFVGGVEKGTAA